MALTSLLKWQLYNSLVILINCMIDVNIILFMVRYEIYDLKKYYWKQETHMTQYMYYI